MESTQEVLATTTTIATLTLEDLRVTSCGRARRACTIGKRPSYTCEEDDSDLEISDTAAYAAVYEGKVLVTHVVLVEEDDEYIGDGDTEEDDNDDYMDDEDEQVWSRPRPKATRKKPTAALPRRNPTKNPPTKRAKCTAAGEHDQVTAFWRAQGVTTKNQLSKLTLLANSRKLYCDLNRIAEKLDQLRLILPRLDVIKIVANAPNLLVYDIKTSIPPKLVSLRRLLPGVDVTKIIASSPHLLTFDIEHNIGPKIRQLKHLLPGANVVKIVNAAPNLLSYDIEASLGVKISKLAELLPGADIVKLIQYAPTLLYHDTANSIAPKLRLLQELLPTSDIVKMVSAAPPLLCSDIEGSVARKLQWMREMVSGTPRQVDEKIESNPRLLTCGYGVVFGRLEFKARSRPDGRVPVSELRSILLTPVAEFDRDSQSGYSTYLATQLEAAKWGSKSKPELFVLGPKKLEGEYGNCLRSIVNKI